MEFPKSSLVRSEAIRDTCLQKPLHDSELAENAEPIIFTQESTHSISNEVRDDGSFEELDSQDQSGFAPLHYAVIGGSAEIVATLLQKGANRSLKDSVGKTALYLAVENGHQDIVKLLLQH